MENIILSILLLKNMTVYELRSYIQKNLSSVCSDSLGSMQTAIKKLIEKNFITSFKYIENNIYKKEYRITTDGIKQFKNWIGTPVNINKVKNMEEGKIFFLGLAAKEKRIISLEGYISELSLELNKLLQIKNHIKDIKEQIVSSNVERIKEDKELYTGIMTAAEGDNLEKVIEKVFEYQMHTLNYGIERTENDIKFFGEILRGEKG